jgi:hypothetical protein
MERAGGCFCGALRYAVQGDAVRITICHCQSCRKVAGAASVAWLSVTQDQFAWTRGAPALLHSSPAVTRTLCAACGTGITYRHDDSADQLDVTLCSLDEPASLAPLDHTWTSERMPWDAIADGLRQYPASRVEGATGP